MRWIFALLLMVAGSAQADDLVILKMNAGGNVAVRLKSGNVEVLGIFDTVTVIGDTPTPPTPPPDEPTGPGQLICVRPWSCTLDESDADLVVRESLDAVKSTIPYLRLLPGTLDQRMQTHPAERYRVLVKDASKAWVFHVVPTKTTPRIAHQGPLDADVALGWVGVKRTALAAAAPPDEKRWLDVDFAKAKPKLTGALQFPPELQRDMLAAATNIKMLPGFKPIPKAEWPAWCARFPVARMAQSVRNITEQTMGSCVGHSCANCVEAGNYMASGDLFFRRLSGMSMYVRIGSSPNSGAYVEDAADEIFSRGLLPVTGEPYPATFPQDTGFSTKLPAGWEKTAEAWKAAVYAVDDPEACFRALMDCRLRNHLGRSGHAISHGGYTGKSWWYENSWGTGWGDYGKSIGYDSSFYEGFVYVPVLRDEVTVLLARELPAAELGVKPAADNAKFRETLRAIKAKAKARGNYSPTPKVLGGTP